jgi:hypothetical protein
VLARRVGWRDKKELKGEVTERSPTPRDKHLRRCGRKGCEYLTHVRGTASARSALAFRRLRGTNQPRRRVAGGRARRRNSPRRRRRRLAQDGGPGRPNDFFDDDGVRVGRGVGVAIVLIVGEWSQSGRPEGSSGDGRGWDGAA